MVASNMETRHLRKRRWKSSPNKTSRAELDFGQRTPSPKKRRQNENVRSDVVDDEQESFTIKSFYGKREKMHFPHSPGRRKKVGEVLNKISDDNTESESEMKTSKNKKSTFQFHSSDSADTDSDYKPISKVGSGKKSASKKKPLDITVKKKEPKTPTMNTRNKKFLSNSTSKIADRSVLIEIEPRLQTPVTGKKFFKTRSPASADKCIGGGIIVRKGFNLQFVANKKGGTPKTPKPSTKKPKAKAETLTPKGVTVKSLKKTVAVEDGVIYFEDAKDDKNKCSVDVDRQDESESVEVSSQIVAVSDKDTENEIKTKNIENIDHKDSEKKEAELHVPDKDLNDSAIDTANSEDLFSNVSDHSGPVVRERPNTDDASSDISNHNGQLLNDRLDVESNLSEQSGPVVRKRKVDARDEASSDVESEQLESGQTTPSRKTPSDNVSPGSDSSSVIGGSQEWPQPGKKLFPIFTRGMRTPQDGRKDSLRKLRSSNSPGGSPLLRYVRSKDTKEQMIIDAGQKRYGVTHCGICGMVYSQAEPADETMHHKFHQGLLNALRFPGWKKEHVAQEFLDSGSRIVMVKAGDPAYATKKIEEINNIMGRELGFPEHSMNFTPKYKAFLYVTSEKRIEGCCITEPISEFSGFSRATWEPIKEPVPTEGPRTRTVTNPGLLSLGSVVFPNSMKDTSIFQGFPVLPGSQSQSPSPQKAPGQRPWYCSDQPKPAVVGISKIWVYGQSRKQGIASRLLECVRQWFEYGTVIPKERVAFSDPTPDGKKLAEKYIGSPEFLVYKFQ